MGNILITNDEVEIRHDRYTETGIRLIDFGDVGNWRDTIFGISDDKNRYHLDGAIGTWSPEYILILLKQIQWPEMFGL